MRASRLLPLLVATLATVATLAATANFAAAAEPQMPKDDLVKGAKDHPLVSRFEGSKMVGYGVKQFDEASLIAGKRIADKDGKMAFDSRLPLEGKYTRIAYNYPADRSALEVMRNYQAALEKAGLKVLFTCAKESCGEGFGAFFLDARVNNNFIQGGEVNSAPFNYSRNDARYLLAKGTRPDGALIHVAVYSVAPVKNQLGGIYLDIVEAKPMETGKVSASLNAADMAKGIAADGKVAVYGILFDTDKTEVKPESKPALTEIAKLLQQDAKLKVYVVGHTDSEGALAHNLELSQKRAEAVVKVLAADYKINARRLTAKGVASYAPAASNDSAPGRDKNRRVELVKQ